MIFDGLDGTLGTEGVLDDGVLVPGGLLLHGPLQSDGLTRSSKSLGELEGNLGPHLLLSDRMGTLLYS